MVKLFHVLFQWHRNIPTPLNNFIVRDQCSLIEDHDITISLGLIKYFKIKEVHGPTAVLNIFSLSSFIVKFSTLL